jgi:hypothetical protein
MAALVAAVATGGSGASQKFARLSRIDEWVPDELAHWVPGRGPDVDLPGCNSFVPGTGVLMADGSTKPIEDVDNGDRVWAADPETGEAGPRAITALITGHGDKTLVNITINDDTITATDEHPFWVNSRGEWIDAEDVQPGDLLLDNTGVTLTVDEVTIRNTIDQTVHNLTIDDLHTYYVRVGGVAALVHNSSCPTIFSVNSAGETSILPVHEISHTAFPDIAANFDRHIVSNGGSPIVDRITGRRNIRANRNAAQQGLPRPPAGMSWEEFPFASTAQGGRGATVNLIPIRQNSLHGGTSLSPFYSAARVGSGDTYYVRSVP